MSDLLRPMLYGAVYEPLLANRAEAEPTGTVRLVGKHCESGDVLVGEASLPPVGPGEGAHRAQARRRLRAGERDGGVPGPTVRAEAPEP